MARKRRPGLRRKGRYWHIEKVIRGYGRFRESTGETDYERAERYFDKRIEELRNISVYGERPRVTLAEAAEKFLTEECPPKSVERAGYALSQVLPKVGHLRLQDVHDETLKPFKDARIRDRAASATINKELSYVRRILILAARKWRTGGQTWLAEAPLISMVRGKARKPYPLEWEEQKRLLAELPDHLKQMVLFNVNTGLRQSELCRLRWYWEVRVPELNNSVFILPEDTTKNGEERIVVLNPVARSVLESQRGMHPEYVFTYNGHPIKRMNNHAFRKARARAQVPKVRVHDLRHTFGHRLRAAGVSFEDRQDLLGHKSGRITTHYSAPDVARLLDAVDSICEQKHATVLRIVPGKCANIAPAIAPKKQCSAEALVTR